MIYLAGPLFSNGNTWPESSTVHSLLCTFKSFPPQGTVIRLRAVENPIHIHRRGSLRRETRNLHIIILFPVIAFCLLSHAWREWLLRFPLITFPDKGSIHGRLHRRQKKSLGAVAVPLLSHRRLVRPLSTLDTRHSIYRASVVPR